MFFKHALVSRDKRQILGYDAAFDKNRDRIQNLVDNSPKASIIIQILILRIQKFVIMINTHLWKIKVRLILLKALTLILGIILLLLEENLNVSSVLFLPLKLFVIFSFMLLINLLLLNLSILLLNLLFLSLILFEYSFWALLRKFKKLFHLYV